MPQPSRIIKSAFFAIIFSKIIVRTKLIAKILQNVVFCNDTFYFFSYYALFLFFFLLGEQKKKNQKRKLADCTSAAKNGRFFPKRRKTCASRSLRCGAFNGKNHPFSSRCSSEVGPKSFFTRENTHIGYHVVPSSHL